LAFGLKITPSSARIVDGEPELVIHIGVTPLACGDGDETAEFGEDGASFGVHDAFVMFVGSPVGVSAHKVSDILFLKHFFVPTSGAGHRTFSVRLTPLLGGASNCI
jgi:hypothetical protein